jgi:hypothetical protein
VENMERQNGNILWNILFTRSPGGVPHHNFFFVYLTCTRLGGGSGL